MTHVIYKLKPNLVQASHYIHTCTTCPHDIIAHTRVTCNNLAKYIRARTSLVQPGFTRVYVMIRGLCVPGTA